MALRTPEQRAHLAVALAELKERIIGLPRDSRAGAELEQSWSSFGMTLTMPLVQKSASPMLPSMPTTVAPQRYFSTNYGWKPADFLRAPQKDPRD